MHTYGFTVTKDGTDEDLKDIDDLSYRRVWDKFAEEGIMIAYKYRHEGDKEYSHIHFHGLLIIERYLEYKEVLCRGYSFRFDRIREQEHFDKLHYYCQHEMREKAQKLDIKNQELKAAIAYRRCMNAGSKPQQQKIRVVKKGKEDKLFTIKLEF